MVRVLLKTAFMNVLKMIMMYRTKTITAVYLIKYVNTVKFVYDNMIY
jgi:hypothetical protein